MTNDPESPRTRLLIRLVQAALDDGYWHENAAPPPDGPAKTAAINQVIQDRDGEPHNAILCAYMYARCQAVAEPSQAPPPWPPDPADLRAAALDWITEGRRFRPNPKPTPSGFDPALLRELVMNALAAGWNAVQTELRLTAGSTDQLADIMLEKRHNEPHWAIILSYFAGRANALATSLERRPTEDPDRWYNQSVLNWLSEQES